MSRSAVYKQVSAMKFRLDPLRHGRYIIFMPRWQTPCIWGWRPSSGCCPHTADRNTSISAMTRGHESDCHPSRLLSLSHLCSDCRSLSQRCRSCANGTRLFDGNETGRITGLVAHTGPNRSKVVMGNPIFLFSQSSLIHFALCKKEWISPILKQPLLLLLLWVTE